MKLARYWLCLACLLHGAASGQSPVGLAIQTQSPGAAISADFSGLSFGTGDLAPYGAFISLTHQTRRWSLFSNDLEPKFCESDEVPIFKVST